MNAMPDTPIRPGERATLVELEDHAAFERRHIGPGENDERAMLAALGYPSRAALIDAVIPTSIRATQPLDLHPPRHEAEALATLLRMAAKNQVFKSYIGQGYYGTYTPTVIQRNVFESPAWYTAYTPYQPEISQGRLEALLNFQTMVAELTGMAIANSSMLDESTAAAEAMTLCLRSTKSASRRFAVA
jgi:glycine dehydrogenase